MINYYLKAKTAGPVKIKVADPYGQVMAEINGKGEAGLNTAQWNMRAARPGQAGMRGGGFGGAMAEPGEYVVTLDAGGEDDLQEGRDHEKDRLGDRPLPVRH